MTVLYWILLSILATISLYVSLGHWVMFLSYLLNKNSRQGSKVPFVGGILLCLTILISPFASIKPFWWAAFIIDFACLPILIMTAIFHLTERLKSNQ